MKCLFKTILSVDLKSFMCKCKSNLLMQHAYMRNHKQDETIQSVFIKTSVFLYRIHLRSMRNENLCSDTLNYERALLLNGGLMD